MTLRSSGRAFRKRRLPTSVDRLRRADNLELGLIIARYSQVIANFALSLRLLEQAVESGDTNLMLETTEDFNDADKMSTEIRSLLTAWTVDNL